MSRSDGGGRAGAMDTAVVVVAGDIGEVGSVGAGGFCLDRPLGK